MPLPPVTAEPLIWQPGFWDWTGSGYSWHHGQYVPAAGHGDKFQPGYWARTPSGWVWQPAHWTS
ncbi:MAG: YXWGXW repeat-containing protein [Acetobacteraceae bacterium]|nr:YXWGXW repeat-containing protein [Acetobacteraceae bacterium]